MEFKINLPVGLFLVFLVLKLTSVITWSWWWIFCPLWFGFAFLIGAAVIVFVLAALVEAYATHFHKTHPALA